MVKQRVDHSWLVALWRLVILAHYECFNAGIPRASGFRNSDILKEKSELSKQKSDVFPPEDFGNESPSKFQNVRGNVKRCEEQLSLNVFVQIVQPSDVRLVTNEQMKGKVAAAIYEIGTYGAVAYDKISLLALEVPNDFLGGLQFRDVSLQSYDTG